MNEQSNTAAPVAPAETPPIAQATPQQAAPSAPEAEPSWLTPRLQREREAGKKDVLKELGVEDPKEVKAALKALRDKQEAEKTELQRYQEKAAAAEAAATDAARYAKALQDHATHILSTLGEEQRAMVLELAGEDPAKQLEVHAKLSARGALKTVAPMPAPANTAPAAQAPSVSVPSQESKKSVWQRMKAEGNHLGAAIYLGQYMHEIFPNK